MAMSPIRPLRVIQISDCHLSELPHTLYRGEDGEGHLHRVIDRIIEWQPDLLLATGDLSEDASRASYSRLAACLDSIDAPVLALPGNHDDPAVMQHFFPDGPWNGPLVTDFDSWRFILLNSKKPCGIEGTLSTAMLDGLSSALEARPDTPALVALHHQPVLVGAHWIDRYALQQPQQLFSLLDGSTQVKALIWGHIHQGFETNHRQIRLLGAPSTAANSVPATDRFTLDARGAACRWFKLCSTGEMETGLMHVR
jgi:Icc protein